jgi:hypothetical protein
MPVRKYYEIEVSRGAALVVCSLIFGLGSGTASAQATRTWVSGVGDDANPCSRTAPCKTFAGAISKTAVAGEINCLDPGGFGAVTISFSVTIACQPVAGGVLVAGTNGINVNLSAGGYVTLKGLDINGTGSAGASLSGVVMSGTGSLTIDSCFIYGFQGSVAGYGIYVNGTSNAKVVIVNTGIRNNLTGVYVAPQTAPNVVIIANSVIESNAVASLSVNTGSAVFLSNSLLVDAPTAIGYSGGFVTSYKNNVFGGVGLPTTSLSTQ